MIYASENFGLIFRTLLRDTLKEEEFWDGYSLGHLGSCRQMSRITNFGQALNNLGKQEVWAVRSSKDFGQRSLELILRPNTCFGGKKSALSPAKPSKSCTAKSPTYLYCSLAGATAVPSHLPQQASLNVCAQKVSGLP